MIRILFSLVLGLAGVAIAAAAEPPTADEAKVIEAVEKLGGRATIDPKLAKEARVAAKFDRATDPLLASLKKLPRVGSLIVFDAKGCTERGVAGLKDLPHLRKLTLDQSPIGDKLLGVVAEFKELRGLSMEESGITDLGLFKLKPLTHLEMLDLLGNPKVTDKGIAAIKSLERLEELYLQQTSITDKGLMDLQSLDGLRRLNVTGTKVTAAAAEKFVDLMPNLRKVSR